MMTGYDSSDDQRPITYFNGYPIYATTLLVIVHVAAFLLCALAVGTGQIPLLSWLAFSSVHVLQGGAVWQFVTYALVHSPAEGIWFAVEMLMLFWFGRQVEQFLGRRDFLRLYVGLWLITPVALTLVGLARPAQHAGSSGLHFAMFVAFAAIYPGALLMFGIAARWFAIILVALYSVQALAFGDLPLLVSLWASTGAAVLYIRWHRGQLTLPSVNVFQRKPKLSVVRAEPARTSRAMPAEDEVDEIDPLLDKIAKTGLDSLTAKERARLEKARAALMKREGR
jgi:membrane associated rhomboid family serine protease